MQRFVIIGLVFLAFVIPAAGYVWLQDRFGGTVSLPATVDGKPGQLVHVTAEASGAVQFWSDAPEQYVDVTRKTVVLVSGKPGRFLVLAWSARWLAPTPAVVCQVVVEGNPSPGPSPPPVPPAPPDPLPPPVSPLAQKLAAAYQRDVLAGVGNMEQKAKLASVYEHASKQVPNQMELKTVGQLYTVVATTANTVVGPKDKVLPSLRMEIAGHLKVALPTKADVQLTPAIRGQAAQVFSEVARALGEVR
jgi:hypothetical protein